ncbi:porin family protein [Flavobacterium sp. SUN052]|uniref:type IX secretion/gliding motility protein PorT/SprT n=1 Tax=Flavobacterium sp. SUN052 TaxID=3002441 RepID=UPI00237EAFEB|nr:porin family protein [Flavobacterium sp. SUN052]MEC4004649.1 porin family protein [Flavobacterium sp. SUN052]
MKKLICILFLILSFQSHSQSKGIFAKDPIINLENFDKQRVYYGYFLGFNTYDFKIDYINTPTTDIIVKSNTGFSVGVVGDLRLHEYINLRFEPGLYYSQKNLTFPGFAKALDREREVRSTFIDFPLLLKFSSKRIGNVRPYLVGGVSATLNLASNSKSLDDNAQQRFRVKPWTQNYEIGFGIDLYLEYFKFSPSIRGVFGLNDELIRDNNPDSPWTGNIASMKSRGVFINFTFH